MGRSIPEGREGRAKYLYRVGETLVHRAVPEVGRERRPWKTRVFADPLRHGAETMALFKRECGIPGGWDQLPGPGAHGRAQDDRNVHGPQRLRDIRGAFAWRKIESRRACRAGHPPGEGASADLESPWRGFSRMEKGHRGPMAMNTARPFGSFERRHRILIYFETASDTVRSLRTSPGLFPPTGTAAATAGRV